MVATRSITGGVARSLEALERVNGYVARHGLRHGLDLARRARPGAPGVLDVEWEGYPRPFRIRLDGGSDIVTFDEVIVDECYTLPFDASPTRIVDAGANIGLTSAFLARRYPDATIVALEPDPANFALLERNLAPFPNVHPHRAALWTSTGTVRLGDPNTGPRGYRVDETTSRGFEVDAFDLPTIMDMHDMDRIDLLKIDVEGAEVELFSDASSWIDRVDAIAIELHDRFRPGCSRAFFGAVGDFGDEWLRGETTFVRRTTDLSRSSPTPR